MASTTSITERQLLSDLKSGKFRPVYLLTGEENYYIDNISNYFEEHIVAPECRDFDQTVLYGRDTNMKSVIDTAKRYPMMSPHQLVLVKEAQDIPIKEWEPLTSYLNVPQPATILVFCYRHKDMDKRTTIYKAIAKNGVVFEGRHPRDYEMPAWIATYVKDHGYAITERAATIIAENIGNDLGNVSNEVDKLFVSLPAGTTINDEIVERNIGISKDYNIFELQRAIGRRNVVLCTRIVNYCAANPKELPIQMVVATLYSFFVKAMAYIQLTDKKDAAKAIGVSPYALQDYETVARNYNLNKLAACIGYLHDTDLRSKGVRNAGTVTDSELLKELLFKIIH